MAVKTDTKEELKEAGLWQEFCSIRDELKKDGVAPSEARDEALGRIEVQLDEWRSTEEGQRAPAPTGSGTQGALEPACCPGKGAPASEQKPDVFAQLTDEQYDEFMARESDIVSQYCWVAKHLDVPPVRLKILEAPCAQAWTLLMDARRTSVRKSEFLDKSYSKLLPSRSNLEDGGGKLIDGMHIAEAIDRLVEIRAKAEVQR